MSILKKAADLFSPSDPELVEKTLSRIAEQDTWNDVFSTKLIEVLDNVDRLKSELRGKMRSVEQSGTNAQESLSQATSHLVRALSIEEKATLDLRTARATLLSSEQKLNAAQELAMVAQGKHIAAGEILRKTVCWALCGVGLSVLVFAWTAWIQFRAGIGLWIPCLVTVASASAVILIVNKVTREL